MINYRIFFLGDDGRIKGNKIIECESDTDAMAMAEQECPDHIGLEVWQSTRMVGHIDAPSIEPLAVDSERRSGNQ